MITGRFSWRHLTIRPLDMFVDSHFQKRWLSTLLSFLLCLYCTSSPSLFTSARTISPLLLRASNAVLMAAAVPSSPSSNSSSSILSSSETGGGGRVVPFVSRVSGCVDDGSTTVDCPPSTTIDLTMYGRNFQRTALVITILDHSIDGDNRTIIPCSTIRVSTDDLLRCTFNVGQLSYPRRQRFDVLVDSALGSSVFRDSLAVTDDIEQPVLTGVSGCSDNGAETRDCTTSSEVRLTGDHFPRWLSPSMLLSGYLEVPCQWKGEVGGVYCSLDHERVDQLPKGQLLPTQVCFSDHISLPVAGLSLLLSQPIPPPALPTSSSSTAQPPPIVVSDDLESVKVTLFVLSVLALVAIMGGVAVWAVGWWMAHKRAFVSANGQAAVDMRRVLLH